MSDLEKSPPNFLEQIVKVLLAVVSSLKGYPIFLFGIATMLIAILSTWMITLTNVTLPEQITWFPHALLIFSIIVILLAPVSSSPKTSPVSQTPDIIENPLQQKEKGNNNLKFANRIFIVLCGLHLLWGGYLGNVVGNGLDSVWHRVVGWLTEDPSEQINYGWIIGSMVYSVSISIGVIVVSLESAYENSGENPVIGSIPSLLVGFAVGTALAPIFSLFFAPVSAFVWWLTSGNGLITFMTSLSIPLLAVMGLVWNH